MRASTPLCRPGRSKAEKGNASRHRARGRIVLGLASLRSDSETVLSEAIPSLLAHLKDPVPRIRANAVNTLYSLSSRIPDDPLKALVNVMEGPDDGLAIGAAHGVARMAGSSPLAEQAFRAGALAVTHRGVRFPSQKPVSISRNIRRPRALACCSGPIRPCAQ